MLVRRAAQRLPLSGRPSSIRASASTRRRTARPRYSSTTMPSVDPLVLARLGHVVEVIDEVGDHRLVLRRASACPASSGASVSTTYVSPLPGADQRRCPSRAIAAACACSWLSNSASTSLLRARQLPQHVRHGDVREHEVVPAGGRRLVAIERRGNSCRASRAPRTRDSTVRSGGGAPNHALRVGRRHRDRHRLADLVGREHQVVLDHRHVDAEVGQPVVAHVLRAVAVEAVVDERARAALQRLGVEAIDRRAAPGAGRRRRSAQRRAGGDEPARRGRAES